MFISAPRTSRAAAAVQSSSSSDGSGAPAIFVPGFARKFCTITSWMCPWRSWRSRIASSASIRSSRVSPMPMRIPVVKGMRSSPASRIVSSRTAGPLVGRAEVRAAALREAVGGRLEHDPLRRRDLAQRGELVARHHSRIRVRQQAGLVEHEAAHAHEVLDRRLAAELGQLFPRRAVPPLRLVAEREQCLPATGGCAGARDVQHLVG